MRSIEKTRLFVLVLFFGVIGLFPWLEAAETTFRRDRSVWQEAQAGDAGKKTPTKITKAKKIVKKVTRKKAVKSASKRKSTGTKVTKSVSRKRTTKKTAKRARKGSGGRK